MKAKEKEINTNSLKNIAIYLEGLKQGRGGNIQPLGLYDLEQLWEAIKFLNKNQ